MTQDAGCFSYDCFGPAAVLGVVLFGGCIDHPGAREGQDGGASWQEVTPADDSALPLLPDAAPPADAPIGQDTTVVAFDRAHVYFKPGDGHRKRDAEVSFPPAEEQFDSIELELRLRCPAGGCDWWDRKGWIGVVHHADGEERVVELHRFITPYRVGASWSLDVTDLRPLLAGDVTLRVFIDTWVGPGHDNGAGWLVTANFEMTGGYPERPVAAVVPLWPPHTTEYGNPDKDPNREDNLDLTALDGVAFEELTGASLWAYVTGHGQGNAQNCAEFCRKRHWLDVDEVEVTRFVWRDDCSTTAAPGQQGTWQYSRAGWCPGAKVHPWVANVSDALASSDGQLTVQHRVADYVNTCRPDASPCTGCALGTSCDYNGGSHTKPIYLRSALLVLYR